MWKTLAILWITAFFQTGVFSQITLGYQLREGDVYTFEQQAEQQVVQQLNEGNHEITNLISGILEFRVLGKDPNDNYAVDFVFRDLLFHIQSNLQGVLLDVQTSEAKKSDVQSRIFQSLLNVPVRMVVNKQGGILQVSGGDSLVARVLTASGLPEGPARKAMQHSLEQQFGSRALARSYEQMTYLYTKQPVDVGDTWENRVEGDLEARNTWTLNSITSERALISGSGEIVMTAEDPSGSMHLEGRQEMHLSTDRSCGFLREMHLISEARGISTSTQTGDLKIPTTISSKVVYRLIDQKHVQ